MNRQQADHVVVIDKHRQVFVFSRPEAVHIIKDAIIHRFNKWEEIDGLPKQTLIEVYEIICKKKPEIGMSYVDVSVKAWLTALREGVDRTDASLRVKADGSTSPRPLGERRYKVTDKPCPSSLVLQARLVHAILKRDAVMWIDEESLKSIIASSDLKTRQDPWRIFQYYRPTLVKCGLLEIER